MTELEALLIAALPALTSIVTFLIATIKFIGKFTKTDTSINEHVIQLEIDKKQNDEQIKDLKNTIGALLVDNNKLKTQLAELLTYMTKVQHKPEE